MIKNIWTHCTRS